MTAHTNHRILVIDDNRAIHDDFRKILCPGKNAGDQAEAEFFGGPAPADPQPGFEMDSAFHGEEGVAALRQAIAQGRPYAMAFVDVRMPPGMDGIETAERLWQLCPELQVVICTAHSDYSWQEMISRLGHRDRLLVLKKPFAAIEALQLACALCEKWKLVRQAGVHIAETERIVGERTHELREMNARLLAEIEQRTQAEAHLVRAQRLESIGTLASGLAHDLNNILSPILMSLGSGSGCDTQFLFSDDILGDYDERPPRHAKAYRNFAGEHRRPQAERIAAFREYVADVQGGHFPERSHLVEMEAPLLDEVVREIGGAQANNQGVGPLGK